MERIDLHEAVHAAIRHWSSVDELVQFALKRHGYANSDGGFGVLYPSGLDDHDREVEGRCIPDGYVEVYGLWGAPDGYEIQIPEWLYRNLFADYLERQGRIDDAVLIRVENGWGLPPHSSEAGE